MHLFIAVFCLSIFFTNVANSQWRRLISKETFCVAVNSQNPKTVYAGGSGRLIYRSFDGGNSWDTLVVKYRNGLGVITNILIHPIDTNIIIIGGFGLSTLIRSSDGGKSWNDVLNSDEPVSLSSESLIMDVNDSDILYMGDLRSGIIFRSLDRGITWNRISRLYVQSLCSLTMLPNSTTIFAGSADGYISISTDSGITWKKVAQLIPSSSVEAEIPRIVFSKRNPLVGYACATFFNTVLHPNGGLFKTIDGGKTWNKIGFADTNIWSIAIRPHGDEDEIFVGGYTEVFGSAFSPPGQSVIRHSINSGKNWEVMDNSLAWVDSMNRNSWMMKYGGNAPQAERLFLASEAGFFVYDFATSVNNDTWENNTPGYEAKLIYGNLTITQHKKQENNYEYTVRLFSLTGEKVLEEKSFGDALFPVRHCSSGMYICEITNQTSCEQIILFTQ